MKPKDIKTKCFIKEDNNKYVCKYCNKSYKENVTRMAIHIKKECPNVPKHIMDIFSPKTSEIFAPDEENLTSTSLNFTPMELKQPEQHVLLNKSLNVSSKKNMLNIVDTMGKQEKIDLDVLLGRAIFSSTVSFSILENDHWLKFFKALRPSYKPPSRYVLSKRILNNEYEKINLEVNNLIKNSKIYGIQIDGCSNIRNESIMNVIVTTPKPYVFKTIDCNTECHTGEYIANELSKVIDELDKNKCLGIVTDNATSMKKAWELLQKDDRYKHLPIAFYPCIYHTLNLLISDIIKLKSFLDIEQKSKDIVKSIINSHILKAHFTMIQKTKKIDCSLKLPVKTKWGSLFICLDSIFKNKHILQQLAVSEDSNVIEKLDKNVKYNILSDIYWEHVENIITLIHPITHWITKLESDKLMLSDVPVALNEIKKSFTSHMSNPTSPLFLKEQNIFKIKFDKIYNMAIHPIHYAANVLDPKYQGKYLPQGCDIEGIEYIQKVALHLLIPNECNKIITELAEYRTHKGLWANNIFWNNLNEIEPRTWWNGLCSNTSLSTVASAILSLPASSAAIERSFSSYSLIHTEKRNRLTNSTAKNENEEELEDDEYNINDSKESEDDDELYGETDSSDDDFFNFIKPTLA